MKLRMGSAALAVLLPLVFLGGIALSAATGHWVTESTKLPARYETGEFAGQYNPGDIRGSYTFGDVAEAFGVPASVLADAYGIGGPGAAIEWSAPLEDFQIKNLEDGYAASGTAELEVGTDSVRWFVALYASLPFEPEETTALPARALPVLREAGVDQALLGTLADRSINLGMPADAVAPQTDAQPETQPAGAAPADIATARTVTGRTTFGELLSWGVSRDAIEQAIGRPAGNNGDSMRDFFAAAGVEFSAYKTALQEVVDSAE